MPLCSRKLKDTPWTPKITSFQQEFLNLRLSKHLLMDSIINYSICSGTIVVRLKSRLRKNLIIKSSLHSYWVRSFRPKWSIEKTLEILNKVSKCKLSLQICRNYHEKCISCQFHSKFAELQIKKKPFLDYYFACSNFVTNKKHRFAR